MRNAFPLFLSMVLLTGCTGKSKLTTETKQLGRSLQVKVDVQPATSGTLQFKGHPAFEKLGPLPVESGTTLVVDIPLASIPKGKYTVTMEFAGQGRGLAKKVAGKGTLEFERVAAAPSLKLVAVPKPGVPTIQCKGALCETSSSLGTMSVPFGPDAKLYVDLTDCDGCNVDVGGQKIAVRGEHTIATIDLTNAIANAPPGDLTALNYMELPFKITLEGATTEVPFEVLGSILAGTVLRRVAQGPLTFAGDAAATNKAAVVVRKEVGYGVVSAVGTAKRVRDYDIVGVATAIESSLGSCGVYTKSDTQEVVNVAHKGITYDVTMYDRRSGKPLGRRSFPPVNEACGDKLVGGITAIKSLPASPPVDAWARTFLK